MNIKDANILITGGARGIGNHLALKLAGQANSVIIIDNNAALLSQIQPVKNIYTYVCDITSSKDVEQVVSLIFEERGGVNVLINNAGIIHSEPLFNMLSKEDRKHSLENWNRVMNVNLTGVFITTSNVVEKMISKKTGGIIINISSIAAKGNIGQSAYSATKAAVEALTKTWSKELGMFKIRCSCIAPGFFNTPSTLESLNEHMLKKWQKNVPLGRLGELDELLSATEFIIENDYFNGKILELDGGLTI